MIDIAENAADYFVDRHATSGYRDKFAFVEAGDEQRSLTYGKLAEETGRLAHLLERHGIQHENRVALLLLDKLEFPIIFWGCLKAGVIPVALNTLLVTDVYGAILRDSRARALFVSHELLPVVAPLLKHLQYLKKVFVVGGEAPPARSASRANSRPAKSARRSLSAPTIARSGSIPRDRPASRRACGTFIPA